MSSNASVGASNSIFNGGRISSYYNSHLQFYNVQFDGGLDVNRNSTAELDAVTSGLGNWVRAFDDSHLRINNSHIGGPIQISSNSSSAVSYSVINGSFHLDPNTELYFSSSTPNGVVCNQSQLGTAALVRDGGNNTFNPGGLGIDPNCDLH